MARKSLRPQLNQIRAWTRQGRTDAWVAHQLEVSVQQIQAFKRENGLAGDGEQPDGVAGELDFDDEIDLRAEDDALIAAELEAAEAQRALEAEAEAAAKAAAKEAAKEAGEPTETETEVAARRRRGRRGGRGRRGRASGPLEGTFDHGEEGYGLWLDPAVVDDRIYAEHWAGHRPVEVTIEEDQIVIRRSVEADAEAAETAEAEPAT
ncbi:MAG TPA: hypothetical protein VG165_07220 [Solirubrobacteraceae bacterium]|jgi:hypothetical protein|nr:hypothetical protein [Solirubrobacteraceae bacterium]